MTELQEPTPEQKTLGQDVAAVLNRHIQENRSDTPDFILADFMVDCLRAFECAIYERERWYGRSLPSEVVARPVGDPR